jgi:hypothetical protein
MISRLFNAPLGHSLLTLATVSLLLSVSPVAAGEHAVN